jgi:hypothetical protein
MVDNVPTGTCVFDEQFAQLGVLLDETCFHELLLLRRYQLILGEVAEHNVKLGVMAELGIHANLKFIVQRNDL